MQLVRSLIVIGTLVLISSGLIIADLDSIDDSMVQHSKKEDTSPQVFQLVNGVYLEKRKGGSGGRSSFGSISSSSSSSSGSTKGGSTSSGSSTSSKPGMTSYPYQCGMVSGRNTCGYGPNYAPTAAAAAAGYGTARYHGLRNTTSEQNNSSNAGETTKSNGGAKLYKIPSYGIIFVPMIFALI
ncbi:hypothetical protein JA1_003390 [Spathaspora sp. JA1]|nr:hypothetical protein JA1_003390 [Spathaspora sp. JA1]